MRIALVSPYSWTYPGGVTRHIEALAEQHLAAGHDVRVLAPVDPDDLVASRMHRGARPALLELPEWLIPLGRTLGFPSNGAVSNVAYTPGGVSVLRRELRAGGFDVVHLHEPVAPFACWDTLCASDAPLVRHVPLLLRERHLQQRREPHGRAPPAEPPARAHRGLRGRGVDGAALLRRQLPRRPQRRAPAAGAACRPGAAPPRRAAADRLRRPGGRAQGPARAAACLRGAARAPGGAAARGRRDRRGDRTADARHPRRLRAGQVQRRGQARRARAGRHAVRAVARRRELRHGPDRGVRRGTPVVASDIAGYRDVVCDGVDGVLVPRGDPTALAEVLRDLALDPARRDALAGAAARSAAALRVAAGRRRGAGRLRGRDRDARARRCCPPC